MARVRFLSSGKIKIETKKTLIGFEPVLASETDFLSIANETDFLSVA